MVADTLDTVPVRAHKAHVLVEVDIQHKKPAAPEDDIRRGDSHTPAEEGVQAGQEPAGILDYKLPRSQRAAAMSDRIRYAHHHK